MSEVIDRHKPEHSRLNLPEAPQFLVHTVSVDACVCSFVVASQTVATEQEIGWHREESVERLVTRQS